MMLRLKGADYPSSPERPTSPLLHLPAELRNQVYTLCLTPSLPPASPGSMHSLPHLRRLSSRHQLSFSQLPALHLCPSLLATCSQIHAEAGPILYRANTFCAHPAFLNRLPFLLDRSRPILCSAAVTRIKRWYVSVRLDADPGFCAADAAAAFSGAERLELEVWQAVFEGCDFRVLRLFEDVRGVECAVVKGILGSRYKRYLEGAMMSESGADIKGWVEKEGEENAYEVWKVAGR